MIKKLFHLIESTGVKVYLPSKKTGKCTHPYAVVKEEESRLGVTGRCEELSFTVSVAVPLDSYGQLEPTKNTIKTALKNSPFKFRGSNHRKSNSDIEAYICDLFFAAAKRVD